MDNKINGQNIALFVTGSKAPVLSDSELTSKRYEPIKPTTPKVGRMLHSSRSTKISYKALHASPDLPSTHLSFSAASFAMPLQYVPISVVLDADLPGVTARKQSVIFRPRKEEANSLQNTPRMLASGGCIQNCFSDQDLSKHAFSNSSTNVELHVDVALLTISPRPPAPSAINFSPINLRSKPRSSRIIRQVAEHNSIASPAYEPVKPIERQSFMHRKRRVGDADLGSLDISELPEKIRQMHETFETGQAIASPHACVEVSQADQVSALENWVQNDMNKSQFDRDMCQRIVTKASTGNTSTLKFEFPHSSPAQLFILHRPIMKLSETRTMLTKPKPSAPLKSTSTGAPSFLAMKNDNSVDPKNSLCTSARQEASPRQKNTFYVQKDAFFLKDVARSNPRTTPYQEIQHPILFNNIGPLNQNSGVHDSRATDAALTVLTMKPSQVLKNSAEHQKYHMMCNNRVPDFFLAAMHRK
jgi:hypothetical protein